MAEPDDWRVTNQTRYLRGVALRKQRYSSPSTAWDHDHCEFCWQKFMDVDDPAVVREGYTTADSYYWICETCYETFKDRFGWRVASDRADEERRQDNPRA